MAKFKFITNSLFPRIFPVFRLGFLIVAETFGEGVGGVLVLALGLKVVGHRTSKYLTPSYTSSDSFQSPP